MVAMRAGQAVVNIPPLESGDRLSRAEFEVRYQAAPQIRKAELVEGVVYVASPVRAKQHGRPHAAILAWLGAYWLATPGVDLQDNATVRLDAENEPQPDALLRLEPAVGGQSVIAADDYIEGAPELIVEVAASSAAYDLNDKLRAYCRNRVREYIVWQTYENELIWFVWRAGKYDRILPDAEGILRSECFPGLWLARDALLQDERSRLLAVVQAGLQTAEHQAFVQKLRHGDPVI